MQAESKPIQGIGARMGNRVTVGRWKGHQFYKWRANYIEGGKRKKKGFKTKKEADKWAAKHEAEALVHGTGAALTSVERATVLETRDDLAKCGLTLREAVQYAIGQHRRTEDSITVSAAVAEIIDLKTKAGMSDFYINDLTSRLNIFAKDFGDRMVSTVSHTEIEDWLHKRNQSPISTNKYIQLLSMMFARAVKGGFLESNPAEKVEKARVRESEIGILSPGELKRLLEKVDAEILPVFAIGAFAGLRRSEIERLEWSDVNLDSKNIRVRKSKTSAGNRIVELLPALHAWLEPYAGKTGKVWPCNGRKLYDISKRTAGFGNPKTLTEKEKKKGLKLQPWPDNALRHSFASHHLAHYRNADDLALTMGHRGTDLIFRHYRALVDADQAAAYWAIRPKRKKA